MAWITPVTNRAYGDQYTFEDVNRVGNDIQYLADLLNSYGYAVSVSPKTTWGVGEKQRVNAMTQYLADLAALKTSFYGTITLPSTMDAATHTEANNIEKLLLEIEDNLTQMAAAFRYCGELICGEDQ